MVKNYDRVFVITGGVSGIGFALASALIKKGATVAVIDVNLEDGTKKTDELGPNASFYQADVSSYESQAEAFKSVWKNYGRIDGFVANAGILDRSSLYLLRHKGAAVEDIPAAPNMKCTEVNYKGVIYGIQLAIHFMRHNPVPGGQIVAMGSIAGILPEPTYPEYSGTKAAVINYVQAIAKTVLIKDNINVNVVCPGAVMTGLDVFEYYEAMGIANTTPIETVVSAFEDFLTQEVGPKGKSGLAVECSRDLVIPLELRRPGNGKYSVYAVTPWEGSFRDVHGEVSELPGAYI